MPDPEILEGRGVAARVWAALRRRAPQNTAAAVAARTGIGLRTVRGWSEGQPPIAKHFGRLVNVYGPGLAGEVWAPHCGADGAGWTRRAALHARFLTLRAALTDALTEVDGALAELAASPDAAAAPGAAEGEAT